MQKNKSFVKNRNISASLQDVSTSLLPKCSKAVSEFNISKSRKSLKKYAHVQSKVKQYRMEIKKQQQEFRMKNNKSRKLPTDHKIQTIKDETDDESDETETVEALNQQLNDQKDTIAVLETQNRELLKQVADLQVRLDYFRIELSNKICTPRSLPVTSSKSKLMYRNSLMNRLQSPFKMIGEVIKTPLKTKTADSDNDDSSISISMDTAHLSLDFTGVSSFECNKTKATVYETMESPSPISSQKKNQRTKSFVTKVRRSLDKVATFFKRRPSIESDSDLTASANRFFGSEENENNNCSPKMPLILSNENNCPLLSPVDG